MDAPKETPPVGDILSAIGNTPLVEIKSLSAALGRKIFGKCEMMNPGGSVKDRPALRMITEAENAGLLKPGDTIVEGTGGNTGVGLALVAAAKGYKAIMAMPASIAREKIDSMKVYGAQVKLCQSAPFTSMDHYFHVAKTLGEKDGFFFCNQFENLNNSAAHFETTGPEIFSALQGNIDGFVCSAGTGGTISGISRYLKAQDERIQCYLIDPVGSGLFDYVTTDKGNVYTDSQLPSTTFIKRSEGDSMTEGIGIGRVTKNFSTSAIDGAFRGTDREAVEMAYYLLQHDGIFLGPSASLNVVGAVKLARTLPAGSSVVTIFCDGGANYRSKLYNEEWLKEKELLPQEAGKGLDFVH
jgi:cysteine synthase